MKRIFEDLFQGSWTPALHRLKIDELSPLWEEILSKAVAALEAKEETAEDIQGEVQKKRKQGQKLNLTMH